MRRYAYVCGICVCAGLLAGFVVLGFFAEELKQNRAFQNRDNDTVYATNFLHFTGVDR